MMNTVQKLVAAGNPWHKYCYNKSVSICQYGKWANTHHLAKVLCTNSNDTTRTPRGMKLEVRNTETGKIKKLDHIHPYYRHIIENENNNRWDQEYIPIDQPIDLDSLEVVILWTSPKGYGDNKTPGVYVSADIIEFRIEDKLLRQTAKFMDNVKVGDFVKCRGTRSGDWNKVESINSARTLIYGPKYTKPEEGYMRYTSSDNGIEKIMKIIRNGKELIL